MIRTIGLSLCLWLLAALPAAGADPKQLPGNSVYQLQARLLDQAGRPVQWRDLRGKPRIATMFYSNCPYMCPLIIETGKGIDRALTPAERCNRGRRTCAPSRGCCRCATAPLPMVNSITQACWSCWTRKVACSRAARRWDPARTRNSSPPYARRSPFDLSQVGPRPRRRKSRR